MTAASARALSLPLEISIQIGSRERHHQRAIRVAFAKATSRVRAFRRVKEDQDIGARKGTGIIEIVEQLDPVSE